MAAMLKKAAAAKANKGPPSSFYRGESPNPVVQALEDELSLYVGYMKKRAAPGYSPPRDEAFSRA